VTLPPDGIPINNFRQVNEWLYRGGQPSLEALAALKELNIKTVVSLRWRPMVMVEEEVKVNELGMQFINIRLNYWTLPATRHIVRFFEIIDNEENRPIFVHCFHGADRTGLCVAMYRIARCGWTFDQAYQEMVDCGFHRFRVRHFKWILKRMSALDFNMQS